MVIDQNQDLADLTIVIPTYNRAHILNLSLSKLAKIEHIGKVKIIIVDNGSTDDTYEVVKNHSLQSLTQTRYIKEKNVGLSFAKNRGWKECETKYLVYLDDDCFPHKQFLLNCEKWISQNRIIVSGKCERWSALTPEWIKDEFFIENPPQDTVHRFSNSNFIKGGVMLVAMSVFEEIGGFDPHFGMQGERVFYGEDSSFADRALKANIEVFYDPDLVIYHRSHFSTPREILKSKYEKGYSYYRTKDSKESVAIIFLKLLKHSLIAFFKFGKPTQVREGLKKNLVSSFSHVMNLCGQFRASLSRII